MIRRNVSRRSKSRRSAPGRRSLTRKQKKEIAMKNSLLNNQGLSF